MARCLWAGATAKANKKFPQCVLRIFGSMTIGPTRCRQERADTDKTNDKAPHMNKSHAAHTPFSCQSDWASHGRAEHWPGHADRAQRSCPCTDGTEQISRVMRGTVSNLPVDNGRTSIADGAGPSVAVGVQPNTILREGQVIAATGLGRSSVWAYGNPRSRYYDPTFPKPIKLGVRSVGWRASEVFLWIASRVPAA